MTSQSGILSSFLLPNRTTITSRQSTERYRACAVSHMTMGAACLNDERSARGCSSGGRGRPDLGVTRGGCDLPPAGGAEERTEPRHEEGNEAWRAAYVTPRGAPCRRLPQQGPGSEAVMSYLLRTRRIPTRLAASVRLTRISRIGPPPRTTRRTGIIGEDGSAATGSPGAERAVPPRACRARHRRTRVPQRSDRTAENPARHLAGWR